MDMGYMIFILALCCCTFSILCYFLSSELRGDKDDKPKELTIVDNNGKEYSVGEYLSKSEHPKEDNKDVEFDIKPNTVYHKVIHRLEKDIEESNNYEDMGRYRAILNVFESDQYSVQKRVVISSKVLEECIDYWPEAFDGIECLIDDNGNGIPDEAY
jgi:hypothetical protein